MTNSQADTPSSHPTGHATVALVTGANKGIGRAVASELSAGGMTVILGSRDPARGEEAANELRAAGREVHAVTLDVTDAATIGEAAAFVEQHFGRLDVLVNNAGISGSTAPLEASTAPGTADLDLVRQVFETNVFGVIAVTNTMLPLLRRSPQARIINVSSGVGSLAHMTNPDHYMSHMPAHVAYPPSKTALNALTVQYAKDLQAESIDVNAVAPGACATDFTRHLGLEIPRTAADGAAIVVQLATAPKGQTSGFFDDNGPVPW